MAAIDTIEVLDNLQFEHLNTADIYTVHADAQVGESVISQPFVVDPTVSGVRVLFNNNYGATGSTVMVRARATLVTALDADGITKTQDTQLLEWTSLALANFQLSSELDCSGILQTTLHLDVAVVGTTAHLGTEIIIQGRKEATVNEWSILGRWAVLNITAFKTDVLSTANAGQKVIAVNNPTAGNLNHIGKFIFIFDATPANSEICFQSACGADA
jgi:hypothetical protein